LIGRLFICWCFRLLHLFFYSLLRVVCQGVFMGIFSEVLGRGGGGYQGFAAVPGLGSGSDFQKDSVRQLSHSEVCQLHEILCDCLVEACRLGLARRAFGDFAVLSRRVLHEADFSDVRCSVVCGGVVVDSCVRRVDHRVVFAKGVDCGC
jgi:hypothetical protein